MPPGLHLGSRVRSYCSVCIEVYLAGQRVFIPVLRHSVAQGLSCLANILFPTFAAGDDIYYLRASVAKVTQYPERSMVSGTDDCMRVFHHAACSAADNIAFRVYRWQFSVVQCWWKEARVKLLSKLGLAGPGKAALTSMLCVVLPTV